jgi:hypothetical protein
MIEKTCAVCGAPFTSRSRKQKCCTAACATSAREKSRTATKICPVCSKEYPGLYNRTCCSTACYAKHLAARSGVVKKKPKDEMIACKVCGFEFYPRVFNQIYCSPACNDKGWYRNKKAKAEAAKHEG